MNCINPRMIVLARESRGLSQTELALQIGVSQSKVAKYEAAMLEVSKEDTAHIATTLNYPVAFFEQPNPSHAPGTTCIYHRKRKQVPLKKLATIHARLGVMRMQVSKLMRMVELDREPMFPRFDIDDFDEDPAEIARCLRQTWGIPCGPVDNLVAAIEEAGGIIVWCDFGTDKIDAIGQRSPDLPPLFFVNDKKPADRVRWTLAHEIGHILMHTVPHEDQERQADLFASEFLVPEQEARSDFRERITLPDLAKLKMKWKVSIQALTVRAYQLGFLTDSQYHRMFARIGALGWRQSEPVTIPREKASTLSKIISTHLKECGLSVAELCQLVISSEAEFCAQYMSDRPVFRLAQ